MTVSPHFPQAFYCEIVMSHLDCGVLDLAAQRTASTPTPESSLALSSRNIAVPRYQTCERYGLTKVGMWFW